MFCWLCNASIEATTRPIATTFHFWVRCCPRCTQKYGALDESGNLVYEPEKPGK